MKVFTKFLFMSIVVSMVAGCASNNAVLVPQVPQAIASKYIEYTELPANKVFVVAIAPNGQYAFGYESGQETLEDAVLAATRKLDASREVNGVLAKSYIYAINDDIVFDEMVRAAAEDANNDEYNDLDVQLEELEGQDMAEDADLEEMTEEEKEAEVSEAGLNVPETEEIDPMFNQEASEDAEETTSEFGESLQEMFSDVVE